MRKTTAFLAVVLLTHWVSPDIEASHKTARKAQTLTVQVFDGQRWQARRTLTFTLENLSGYESYMPVIRRRGVNFSGRWQNAGKRSVRVLPTHLSILGGWPGRFPVREVMYGTYASGNPRTVLLKTGESARRSYSVNFVKLKTMNSGLRDGVRLSCEVLLRVGQRLGRFLLPVVKLRAVY